MREKKTQFITYTQKFVYVKKTRKKRKRKLRAISVQFEISHENPCKQKKKSISSVRFIKKSLKKKAVKKKLYSKNIESQKKI